MKRKQIRLFFLAVLCLTILCACASLQEKAQDSSLFKGKKVEVNFPINFG